MGREVNLLFTSKHIAHFAPKVVFLVERLWRRERDVKEPGLCPRLCVSLGKSIPLSVGGVWGSNFILSKHPSHSNIPEPSPAFSFSEFPHLQALVCALLKKEREAQGGEGTRGWAAERHQLVPHRGALGS